MVAVEAVNWNSKYIKVGPIKQKRPKKQTIREE
jgi:hypothetical protein